MSRHVFVCVRPLPYLLIFSHHGETKILVSLKTGGQPHLAQCIDLEGTSICNALLNKQSYNDPFGPYKCVTREGNAINSIRFTRHKQFCMFNTPAVCNGRTSSVQLVVFLGEKKNTLTLHRLSTFFLLILLQSQLLIL